MSKFRLSRRSVLRGLGSAAVLKLCPLEAMFDSTGKAYGQNGAAPNRFVLFFQGNGIPARAHSGLPCRWVPTSNGSGLVLNQAMTPMAPLIENTRVISGTSYGGSTVSGEPHAEAMSWSLSGGGTPRPGQRLGGPTPDFILAKTLQGTSPHKQLILGICRGTNGSPGRLRITADDGGNLINPEFSPQSTFNKLFGNFTPPSSGGGGSTGAPNPESARQKLIVDYVKGDADRLKARLGRADAQRLDSHLASIRDLEGALFPEGRPVDAGSASSCVKPEEPGTAGDANLDTRAKWTAELAAMAFACDLTRVVSIMGTAANSMQNLSFLGLPYDFHDSVSHLNRGQSLTTYMNEMVTVTRWHLKWFEYLMSKLKSYQDIGGSVLDNTLGVFTSEYGNSHYHSRFDVPYLLVGGSKFLQGNFHYRSPGATIKGENGESNRKVWYSVLKALGSPITDFAGQTSGIPLK